MPSVICVPIMSVLFVARFDIDYFAKLTIVASNDINEDTIHSLNQQVRAHAACTRQSMLFSASLLIWKLYYSVLNTQRELISEKSKTLSKMLINCIID